MKKIEKQICMSCLGDFEPKDVYWVMKKDHQILHCSSCLTKNKVENYIPYKKPRKTKTKENKSDIKEKIIILA